MQGEKMAHEPRTMLPNRSCLGGVFANDLSFFNKALCETPMFADSYKIER